MPVENLTVQGNLGDIRAVDLVTQFGYSIQELMDVLGVTRRLTYQNDQLIQTYKRSTTLATNLQVGEGETIPLSTVKVEKDKAYTIPLDKIRKSVSLEAIRRFGKDEAVTQTDNDILEEIQELIKARFFDFLIANPTKNDPAETLQSALTLGWAKTKTFFKGNVDIVSLVSPMDVAKYLGDAPINSTATTPYGFTTLTNFVNQKVLVFDSLPEGVVYTTAAKNIILANQDVSSSDIANEFGFTTDGSGLVGVAHTPNLTNLTTDSVFVDGVTVFAEVTDGVVATPIGDATVPTAPAKV